MVNNASSMPLEVALISIESLQKIRNIQPGLFC